MVLSSVIPRNFATSSIVFVSGVCTSSIGRKSFSVPVGLASRVSALSSVAAILHASQYAISLSPTSEIAVNS